jgi:hypothetical protein
MKTKRIRMLVTESGTFPGWGTGTYHCRTGTEYDAPEKLANAWIARRMAEAVKEQKKPEPKAPQKPTTKPKE